VDLSPAKWIWLPSRRTLANTFVLFRKEVEFAAVPDSATGWILADSRYRLTVNGKRVQWGPAPQDPRFGEVDPFDLRPYLRPGKNVIGVEVLFYGHGEGTWPFGKPGLLFKMGDSVVSDSTWQCQVDRAHRPGQYRRWFLRALQEEFDARQHPFGWDTPKFDASGWLQAMELSVQASRAVYAGGYSDYANEIWMVDPSRSTLIKRSIPLMKEEIVPVAKLIQTGRVAWKRDPNDWFEFRVPNSFQVHLDAGPTPNSEVVGDALLLTYELEEEVVGWPRFTIEAPEGTIIELMVQESHDPIKTPWLDSHLFAWTRIICREGENAFETFDFECLKFIQLHVRNHSRPVRISLVGVRRRQFDWPNEAKINVNDPALQRLFDAAINTLHNSAQETIVDGMGRERQQYSGDGSHQLHAVRQAFGETRLPERFLRTFGQGQMLDGVFADSWPAVDRLQRLWERNVDSSGWGPLLDHSVGFCFDHFHHWMQTGDLEPARQNWPKLMKFYEYLKSIVGEDGLLPVEDLGTNAVWIDHDAFKRQRHKQCAFNLYASAMLTQALCPLGEALGEPVDSMMFFGMRLGMNTEKKYWDPENGLFVSNLPWVQEEGEVRLDDRSLATAVLYEMTPDIPKGGGGRHWLGCMEALANEPPEMGRSYPANVVWNFWALGKAGRVDVILKQMRDRWATMHSVLHNNSIQEFWTITPDTSNILSHCAMAPLIALHQVVMGLQPVKPGYAEFELRPQLGDLEHVDLTAYTPVGPVRLVGERVAGGHQVRIEAPAGSNGYVRLGKQERPQIRGVWEGVIG
jgi:hypothetical protein